jgi:hypothetical protein
LFYNTAIESRSQSPLAGTESDAMNRFVLILIVLVVVGVLAFSGFKYYQTRQNDIANLNTRRQALDNQRTEIFNDEIGLRKIVLTMNYEYDQCFYNPPPKLTNGLPPPLLLIPLANSITLPENVRNSAGQCVIQHYSNFETEYGIYLDLIYSYNVSASQINYEAAGLGEPPVPLLAAYSPAFR